MEKWRLNGFFNKAQLHRWSDAIPMRYSCRSFAGEPSISQWTTLSYAATRFSLPGVRIVLGACDESFFTPTLLKFARIEGASRFAAILADYRIASSSLFAGISGEALILEAASCGVSSCWVTGTYRKKETPIISEPYELVVAVIPLGLPKAPPQLPIKRKRKSLKHILADKQQLLPEWVTGAAEAVLAAPSAMNLQPWKLNYRLGALTYTGKGSIDDGIAILHIETALWNTPRLWTLEESKNQVTARIRLLQDN